MDRGAWIMGFSASIPMYVIKELARRLTTGEIHYPKYVGPAFRTPSPMCNPEVGVKTDKPPAQMQSRKYE